MSEVDPFSEEYDEEDVDLSPENAAPSRRLERFKGEKDKIYRIALLYFQSLDLSIVQAAKLKAKESGEALDKKAVKAQIAKALEKRAEKLGCAVDELERWQKLDLSTARFKKHFTQYLKADGGGLLISRAGKDGPEADRYWAQAEEGRTYYWTIILKYPVDQKGNLDTKAIMRDAEVKPWRFSDGTFNMLIEKNEMIKNFGPDQSLANCDLKLKCKNAQFQGFDIDPAGSSVWLKADKIRDKFLPMAVDMYDRMVDAREMSTADLKEKLGVSGGRDSGEDVSDDVDMEELLDNV